VRCDADERQRLDLLCRTITRPALANERVKINSAGQVVLKLKTAWRHGTTHAVMSPLEFMQRLAARANERRLSGTCAATMASAPRRLPNWRGRPDGNTRASWLTTDGGSGQGRRVAGDGERLGQRASGEEPGEKTCRNLFDH